MAAQLRTITKSNSGTLTFGTAASSFATNGDELDITGGTVESTNATALGTVAVVTLNDGCTFSLGASQHIGSLGDGASVTNHTAIVTNNTNTAYTLTVGNATYNPASSFSGVVTQNGTDNIALTKAGAGTLTLSGSNTFAGIVTVSAGTLSIPSIAAATTAQPLGKNNGAAAITLSGGKLSYTGNNASSGKKITLGGDSTLETTTAGQTLTLSGVMANNTYLLTVGGAGNTTLSGVIGNAANTGGVTKIDAGTLKLSAANTYTGTTTVSAGTLQLGGAGGAANTPLGTTDSGTIVSSGATLDLNRYSLGTAEALQLSGDGVGSTAGALTNSWSTAATYKGLITLGSDSRIVANNGNIIISNTGIIIGSGYGLTLDGTNTGSSLASIIGTDTGSLTKTNTGTWTLTGANTYTGATAVNNGKLILGSSGSLGNTAITVASSAIFAPQPGSGSNSAGTGTAALTLNSASTFDMTDTAAGTFNLNGTAAISGATLNFDLSSAGADQLAVAGAASVSGTNNIGYTAFGASLTVGSYNLITAPSGLDGGAWQLTDGGLVDYVVVGFTVYQLTLSNTATAVTLTVAISPPNVWNGGVSSDWDNLNNWSLGVVPFAYQLVQIGNGAPLTYAPAMNAPGSCLGVQFSDNAIAISGPNTLTIGSGGITTVDSLSYAVNCPVALNGAQTWTVNGTLAASGGISGTGGLTTAGSGTLTLTNNNTYTGNTTISAGTLQLGDGTTNGAVAGNITDNAALKFMSTGTQTFAGAISGATGTMTMGGGTLILTGNNTYGGTTTVSSGTLQLGDGTPGHDGTLNGTGGIALGANALIFNYNGSPAAYSGVISGATGTVTKSGGGTLTLTGTNTYGGSTTINAGTLQLGDGTTNGAVAGDITDNASLTFMSANTQTYGGVISGSGGLTMNGSGVLTLTGASTYTGATNVSGGELNLGASASLDNTAISVANGAIFGPQPGSGSINAGTTGAGTLGATLTLNSGSTFDMTDTTTGTFNLLQQAGFGGTPLTISGATLNFDLSSAGPDQLAFIGAAAVSGTNNIGITTVDTSLSDGQSYNLITGTSGLNGGVWQFTGGSTTTYVSAGDNVYQLTLSSSPGAVTVSVALSPPNIWNGGTSSDWDNADNWSLGIVPGSNQDVQIGNGAPRTNDPAMDVDGSCQSIAFSANATTISGPNTLTIGKVGITADSHNFAVNCPVLLAGSQTWTVNGTGALTAGDVIDDSGSGYGLTKSGSGTLTLSADNTYSGITKISAGTLLVNGSQEPSDVSLNGGALGGTGIVGAITGTLAGGTVNPGPAAAAGTLISDTLTLNSTSTFFVDLNGTGAGQFDQLNVGGAVSLGNSTLTGAVGYAPGVGDSFVIIKNNGGGVVSGTFNNLLEGATVTLGAYLFQISYVGGSGNDVTLTRVLPKVAFASASSSGLETVASPSPAIAVTLSAASSQTVTVNYAVSGASTAVSNVNYTLPAGTLTFNPGITTQNIPITIIHDGVCMPDLTVIITLSSPSNAVLGTTTTYTYTIIDTDLAIIARETQDTDSNGYIDAIRIVTSGPINDNFNFLNITVAGYTVTGYSAGGLPLTTNSWSS